MTRIRLLLCAAAVLGLTAGTVMAWAQSDQPSLADVARQKPAARAKRVVTNDEIPPSPEANNPPAASSAASGPSAPAGAKDGAKPGAGKDGDKSVKPVEKLSPMQQLLAERDNLENIIKHMQEKIEATTDPSRIEMLSGVLQHARENLVVNQQQMDKLKASGAAAGQGGGTPPAASQPPASAQPPK